MNTPKANFWGVFYGMVKFNHDKRSANKLTDFVFSHQSHLIRYFHLQRPVI